MKPSREERNAAIERSLQGATFLGRGPEELGLVLYRWPDGSYTIGYLDQGFFTYLCVSPEGKVTNMTEQCEPDGSDLQMAISFLGSQGLSEMRNRIVSWPHRNLR